ncbi:S8 family serine peptidase [Micromonospora sp. NPDC050417]|uniref:S8 family serine peptidase n=1 Tax=Micromonospora sp. NPDC050417 TaxID=3364280 RepID=UPI0037999714
MVEVSSVGGGRFAASVQPAPGREQITFHTLEADGGLRVLPSDVIPYVSTGKVDADLFDVQELIADGYGDSSAVSLPLIVRYRDPAAGARAAMAGVTSSRALPSIGGAALAAGKASLADFWRAAATEPAAGARSGSAAALGGGIDKIWLDGKVRPVLDRSTAQIGAPAAWQAGYDGTGVKVAVLDTGIDQTHPDIAGKVVLAKNFTTSEDTVDHFGHGTHVAATVAGTGAGSGGTRKGVAPGASLLVGKVLGDDGSGSESWIISGMEWAAAQGAGVINMSLGGGATDGTDPMSEAVNRITAEEGTLFVIAAGNEGAEYTVGSPGAAASALTVGAVDRDESLADFSSRGPRLGDEGLKPEITAPGVDIVAARAAGTTMGTPADELYTAASGTSMATPHVAGAAALLAQQHPDWSPARLKNALVSTARTNKDVSVFGGGAGRVDVARAVSQHVFATGVADFALITGAGPDSAPVSRTVTYTNDGPAPVTLNLALEMSDLGTGAPAGDAITVGGRAVTVPAGGSVEAPVTVDVAKLPYGQYGGWLTATGPDGVVVTTAVAVSVEGPPHTVTFRAVDRAGAPLQRLPVILLQGDNSRSDRSGSLYGSPTWTTSVAEGTYLLYAMMEDTTNRQYIQAGVIIDPELKVDRDIEVILDFRKATPIRIETPKPAEQQSVLSYYAHRVTGTGREINIGAMHFSGVRQVSVTPTKKLSSGEFEFSSRWQLAAPRVQAKVGGVPGPLDMSLSVRSPASDGKRSFPLVDAGQGTPAELKAAKVKGAAVLFRSNLTNEGALAAAAAAAGAAVALMVRPSEFSTWAEWNPVHPFREALPMLVVSAETGAKLIDRVAKRPATLDLTITTASPYLYDVQHVETDQIPEQIVYRVTPENSVRITTKYPDNGGSLWAKEQRFGWRPWQDFAWNDQSRYAATSQVREEWVTAGDSLWQHRVAQDWALGPDDTLRSGMTKPPTSYRPGKREESWYTPVVRPASPKGVPELVSTRTGNTLALRVPEFVDADGHYTIGEANRVNATLWRDGQLLAELPNARRDVTTTSAQAWYRLALNTSRSSAEWTWGTRTETVWDFRSGQRPGDKARPLPLLQVDYTAPVNLDGVAREREHTLRLSVRNQNGLGAVDGAALTAEVSFNEGATWKKVTVSGKGPDFRASIPAGHGKSVSLRVRATDADGNAITQTVIRAYGLS